MKKWFMLDTPPWESRILVSICQTDEEFKKTMNKFFKQAGDEMYDSTRRKGGVIINTYDEPLAIRLSLDPRSIDGAALMNHEISHAVQFLLDGLGMVRSKDSEEAYGYTTSFMTKEILKRL